MRFCALALVVWLGTDALAQGTCSHDLISFAAGRSQVGDTARPHPRSDDVNHCSCHWQYLAAPSLPVVSLHAIAPVVPALPDFIPPLVPRTFERPPQGPLA